MDHIQPQRPLFAVGIRQLRVFEAVARLHSLRRASEACHLTQSAVSQSLAALEQQLGTPLLQRCARGTRPNEFGAIFQQRTQQFFAEIQQALLQLGVGSTPMPLPQICSHLPSSRVRILIAIAEAGSFDQAAHRLRVSRQWLGRAARDLERKLCMPLFAQTAAGIVPLPGTTDFARRLKLAQRELESGIGEIGTVRGDGSGEIRVGVMGAAAGAVLARMVHEFAIIHTDVNIRILDGSARDMLRALREGDVDLVLGLLRPPPCDDLLQEPLADVPYVIAARREHPLVRRGRLTLEDVAAFEWVAGGPDASRRTRFEALFAGRRRPPVQIETSSLPAIRLLLANSNRLALLTRHDLLEEPGALAPLPLRSIGPAASFGLTLRRHWLPTRRQTEFIHLLRRRVARAVTSLREPAVRPGTMAIPPRTRWRGRAAPETPDPVTDARN
jgi:DNA-binding transcriptional LysR family regulator